MGLTAVHNQIFTDKVYTVHLALHGDLSRFPGASAVDRPACLTLFMMVL